MTVSMVRLWWYDMFYFQRLIVQYFEQEYFFVLKEHRINEPVQEMRELPPVKPHRVHLHLYCLYRTRVLRLYQLETLEIREKTVYF